MQRPESDPVWVADKQAEAERFGQAIIHAMNDDPPYAYTAGLSNSGFAELLIFSLPPRAAGRIINYCADWLMRHGAIEPGQFVSLGGVRPLYAIEADDPRTWTEYVVAPALFWPDNPRCRVVQLVVPDTAGFYPPEGDRPYCEAPILASQYRAPRLPLKAFW